MDLPEEIILEIWAFLVQNLGMTAAVLVLAGILSFHLHARNWAEYATLYGRVWALCRRICRGCWRCCCWPLRAVRSAGSSLRRRWIMWRACREFDRLFPEKAKTTARELKPLLFYLSGGKREGK